MKLQTFFFLIYSVAFWSGCSGNRSLEMDKGEIETSLAELEISPKATGSANQEAAEKDSIFSNPPTTASLKDWKNYFRTHNQYKDWNPKDKKQVLVSAITTKEGKPTEVQIVSSCKIDKLDKEALRLIQNAELDPARDEQNNPVRSKWFIMVMFPPT